MNTMQAIARILKMEGVEWISCFPSNNLIEAVAKEGIRPIMFRQERGALMAADGYSRMNNRQKFGVVITQGGPGSENAMGGLAQAFGDNVPILYLPGGPALAQHSVRPNFSPVRTYAVRLRLQRSRLEVGYGRQCDAAGVSPSAQRSSGTGDRRNPRRRRAPRKSPKRR